MKALVLRDYMRLEYTDVPNPAIAPDEVLIRVHACGICGSDVHGMDGSTGRRRPPLIMGHEAAGVIEQMGIGVQDWKEGERVTFDSTIYCGDCGPCLQGQVNLCENRRVLGVSCEDYRRDGAFAEYVAVPARVLYRLPDSLSFTHAAMAEPVSIALHAVRRSGVAPGQSAAVFGAGMIGLLVIQALRMAGCTTIHAVDIDPAKQELALSMGATSTGEQLSTMVDHAFEVVGISETIHAAIQATRKGGAVTLIGNLSARVDFPLQVAVTRELTLFGSCASCGEYPAALEAIASGHINVAPLISASAPLSEGAACFQRLHQKEPGLMKVMLQP